MLKKLLSILLVTSFLIYLEGSFVDRVLCFENDGHVKVETSRNGFCGTEYRMTPPLSHSLQLNQDDHCGPCVDIPLLVSDFTRSESIAKLKMLSVDNKIMAGHLSSQLSFSKVPKNLVFPLKNSFLQTVILRI